MQHAPTILRMLAPRAALLGTGSEDSLQNVNTYELPNGALCWVVSNATLYRLDRASTSASAPDAVIVPAAGPGRWFALSGSAALTEARMSMFQPAEIAILTGEANVWQALTAAGSYAVQTAVAAFWSINATTGVATYSGPPQIYHFAAALNATVDATATVQIQVGLTVDGEDIGTTNVRDLAQRVQATTATSFKGIAIANEIALVPTDTVQLIVRNVTSEDNLLLKGIQIVGIPVGV